MEVTGRQRRWLARAAHAIQPTVMIGKEGLTKAIADRTDAELSAHELIKVRFVDHKEQTREIAPILAERTDAVLVRKIGHVAILYRPSADPGKRHIKLPRATDSSTEGA